MPSAIRKRSYGSVTIFSVDKELVRKALDEFVKELRARPEVVAVVLFGSFDTPHFGVRSDVDLLVVLRESSLPFLDRIPLYTPSGFPVDIDVFPYTLDEVRAGQRVARTALKTGRLLWVRPGVPWPPIEAGSAE